MNTTFRDIDLNSVRPRSTLLIAEAASPERAGVTLIGCSSAAAVSRATDAPIVTHWCNRKPSARAGLCDGVDGNTQSLAAKTGVRGY